MTWNYFVLLADNTSLQETLARPKSLAGGFVDEVSMRFFQGDKENARNRYMRHARGNINIPDLISQTVPDFSNLLSSDWLAFQVEFELLTPWYSKDDRLFHVMDNPVRKDRVFGVPFMAASSWKGMLRWACRMRAGLREFLESGKSFERDWQDPDWILHLFGNEKGEKEDFHRGALVFYPTWFDRIGFEVINPHSRERRAGTQPIYYEVVPPGAKGTLSLLYAPWPGMKPEAKPEDVLPKLLEAIEVLLTTYGISAKRTVGWGTARIERWQAFHKTHGSIEETQREELWEAIQNWLPAGGDP
ncbi:RAMP superfamily CRISPR-associated protein [Rhodothermus profundi]|uniref:CRISPR-associated protein Cmr2 n=1 Tax=Rhodothermus profundi TaxID=633813 RepID=A0A1M6UFE7_9BACT|nr:RAMP superfamily CRISPR-associated protein [Rhodothermus profundi]SHK67995.1 CRISPR-associated protein Cmr2 [Rhodothermus profundi]